MLAVLWDPSIPVPPLELVLQGSMGVPLGAGGILLLGMYQLEPNWWVQSCAGECKGSCPALSICHTTVVLHRSYPDAMNMPSIGVYIYLDGNHWVWGCKVSALQLCTSGCWGAPNWHSALVQHAARRWACIPHSTYSTRMRQCIALWLLAWISIEVVLFPVSQLSSLSESNQINSITTLQSHQLNPLRSSGQ